MTRKLLSKYLVACCFFFIGFPVFNTFQVVKAQQSNSFQGFFESFPKDSLENGAVLTYDEPFELAASVKKPLKLILYALPNGSTMEAAFGRQVHDPNQYIFESQHIGAQTRFIRQQDTSHHYVVVYIGNLQKSWPAWFKSRNEAGAKPEQEIAQIVDRIQARYSAYQSTTFLTGHSGGGRFIFSWIDAFKKIPSTIQRIVFFDATYGYETKKHHQKLKNWLKASTKNRLEVIAYNDSVVIYNGKPLVSPTGGTWYRSQLMAKDLGLSKIQSDSTQWLFKEVPQQALTMSRKSKTGKAEIRLILNPHGLIYHSVLVEKNGFIHSVLEGETTYNPKWFWSERIYSPYVLKTMLDRLDSAFTASQLLQKLEPMEPKGRDSLISEELIRGNFPKSMRNLQAIDVKLNSPEGRKIVAKYWVMPDYLSFGTDENFLRYPLEPKSAQRVGDALGFFLSTAKISDDVYKEAATKFVPQPMTEKREALSTIIQHDALIEEQRTQLLAQQKKLPNTLLAGHKKDVISTTKLFNTDKPNRVALYGWHTPDGKPIQNIYTGHVDWYIDYSHGFRFVWNYILVNGQFLHVKEVFANPELRGILTYETDKEYFRY